MRKFYFFLSCCFLAVFLMQGLGCAAQKAYKKGMEWEVQNEPYLAAKSYLKALSHNPKKVEYVVALKRVAQPAYNSLLEIARASQASSNFPKAVEEYKALKDFITQLNHYNALTFQVINVDVYISDMSQAAAKEKYEAGIAYLSRGAYEQAINNFNRALSFVDNYKDTKEKIAESYYLWAESVVDSNLLKGAQYFEKSSNISNKTYKDSSKRGAEIYFSIGRFYVNRGFCQESLKYLIPANALYSTYVIQQTLNGAQECSKHHLALVYFQSEFRNRPFKPAINQMITEDLFTKVSNLSGKEEYLSTSLLPLPSHRRNLFGYSQIHSYDRLFVTTYTDSETEQGNWERTQHLTNGTLWDRCPEDQQGLCSTSVEVEYTLSKQKLSHTLKGKFTLYQTSDQAVLWTQNFSKTHNRDLAYADKFQVNGVAVTVGSEKALGVVVLDSRTQELAQAERSVQTKSLLSANIAALTDGVAQNIVRAATDDPAPPSIPPRLRLTKIE